MVFFDDDDLIAQWWEEEDVSEDSDDSDDDNYDYDFYIAVAAILGTEHERTKKKWRGSVSGHHQAVMKETRSGKLDIVTNKRPRTDNSTSLPEKVGQDEEDGSNKNQTPDSSQPSQKKRPERRKQAKEKMGGGEVGAYKEALQELLAVKEKERKLKEERWKVIKSLQERRVALEERKLAFEERKLAFEKRKLMWEQEHWIMFCDVSTMKPEQKANVLAMRAQIAAQKMAFFNECSDGASSVFAGGIGGIHGGSSNFGDANGGDIFF